MFRDARSKLDKIQLQLEARGRSFGGQWSLPTSRAMGFFLSMIVGEQQKIRALRWLQTDGLMEASLGRDQLTDELNKKIETGEFVLVQDDVVRLAPQIGQSPSAKVAGMREVREPWNLQTKAERWKTFHPSDLFSPVARKRLPQEAQAWIDQNFERRFEPRSMDLQYGRGGYFRINIDKINAYLAQKGFGQYQFKYGGVDGYFQHIEKGDWLPQWRQRSQHDPNEQHGPDLSEPKVEYDDKGHPVVHFTGGAVTKQYDNYKNAVVSMEASFHHMMEKVHSSGPENLPTDFQTKREGQKETVGQTLMNLIQRSEHDVVGGHAPSRQIFKGLHVKSKQGDVRLEQEELANFFLAALKWGLKLPHRLRPEKGEGPFDNKALNAELARPENERVIKSLEEAGSATAKRGKKSGKQATQWVMTLTEKGVGKVIDYITPRNLWPSIKPMWNWPAALGIPGNRSMRGYASRLLDEVYRKYPQFSAQMKNVVNAAKEDKDKPDDFIQDLQPQVQELTPEIEQEFRDRGYRWRHADRNGNWLAGKTKNALHYGVGEERYDNIPVTLDGGKKYYEVPSHTGKKAKVKKGGLEQGMLLGGDVQVTASQGRRHVEANPAHGKEEYDRLLNALLKGEMGEGGHPRKPGRTFSNPMVLPSVIRGVNAAINRTKMRPQFEDIIFPTNINPLGEIGTQKTIGSGEEPEDKPDVQPLTSFEKPLPEDEPLPDEDDEEIVDPRAEDDYYDPENDEETIRKKGELYGTEEDDDVYGELEPEYDLDYEYEDAPKPQKGGKEGVELQAGEILEWGVAALYSFAGDPAFKFGYLTEEELQNIKKWSRSAEVKKAKNKGRGIFAILKDRGIVDPRQQNEALTRVLDIVQQGGTWEDLLNSGIPNTILGAIGRNALMARTDAIARYVSRRMEGIIKERRQIAKQAATDERGQTLDDQGAQSASSAAGEEAEDHTGPKSIASISDLRQRAGIDPPVVPDDTPDDTPDDDTPDDTIKFEPPKKKPVIQRYQPEPVDAPDDTIKFEPPKKKPVIQRYQPEPKPVDIQMYRSPTMPPKSTPLTAPAIPPLTAPAIPPLTAPAIPPLTAPAIPPLTAPAIPWLCKNRTPFGLSCMARNGWNRCRI
jgi:hypothetical protein